MRKIIYSEGLFSCHNQSARYLGGQPIPQSSDSPHCVGVRHHKAAQLIDPDELYLGKDNPDTTFTFGWNPYLHVLGWLAWTKLSLDGYENHVLYATNPFKISCAQDEDVKTLVDRYRSCILKNPNHSEIILWGASRGAATVFCTVALHEELWNHVKCIVLEGCFDNVRNVFHSYYGTFFGNIIYDLGKYFTKHSSNSYSPIDLVDRFPKHIKVLFITSNKDEIVDRERTLNLVSSLREAGHTNNELLILKNSTHNGYSIEDREDKNNYVVYINNSLGRVSSMDYNKQYFETN